MKIFFQVFLIAFSIIIMLTFKFSHPILFINSLLILLYLLLYKAKNRNVKIFIDKFNKNDERDVILEQISRYNNMIEDAIHENNFTKVLEYQNKIKSLENELYR